MVALRGSSFESITIALRLQPRGNSPAWFELLRHFVTPPLWKAEEQEYPKGEEVFMLRVTYGSAINPVVV